MTIEQLKDYLLNLKKIFEIMLDRETDEQQRQFVKGEQALANQLLKKLDESSETELIYIGLPLEIWNQIASACISVADYDLITDEIKDDLRKTYYQIKAETR